MEKIENILKYFVYFFPFLLITGPFLPDLILSISVILFLILIFKRKEFNLFNNIYFKIYLLFLLYIIIRSIFTLDLLSIRPSIFYFRFGFFSLAIFYLLKKNIIDIKSFLQFTIIALIILYIDSNYQNITGKNLIGLEKFHPERISSFYGNELILGGTTFKVFCLIVPLIYFLNIKKKNFLSFIIIFMIFSIILLSSERTATGLIFLFVIAFSLLMPLKLKFKIIYLLLVTCLISTFFYYNEVARNRIINKTLYSLNIDNKKYQVYLYSQMHQSHMLTAMEMFKDNYLFGKGPKMYRKVCDDKEYEKFIIGDHSCTTHPHHILVQFLAETGLVGFVFLIFFYFKILEILFKSLKKLRHNNTNLPISLLALIIFLNFFPFLPSGNFFNNWLSMISYLPIPFLMFIYSCRANNK